MTSRGWSHRPPSATGVPGDLAGHDAHAVVVELLAEPQVLRAALVEARRRPRCRRRPRTASPRAVRDSCRSARWRRRHRRSGQLADGCAGAAGAVGRRSRRRAELAGDLEPRDSKPSTATTCAPASVASLVASSPMTPWPKTAIRSPRRTSAASTALRAMAPTRAKVPCSGSWPGRGRAGDRCGRDDGVAAVPPDAVDEVADLDARRRRRRPRRPRPSRSSPSPRRDSRSVGAPCRNRRALGSQVWVRYGLEPRYAVSSVPAEMPEYQVRMRTSAAVSGWGSHVDQRHVAGTVELDDREAR